MNWLVTHLTKEARGRRFNIDDRVRYFTDKRKGKGKGVVLTPAFAKGKVVEYDRDARRYRVQNDQNEIVEVHPRNIIPESFTRTPASTVSNIPGVGQGAADPVALEETAIV